MVEFFEVNGIFVIFDGFKVINNLVFSIGYVELCVIIGLNGVGKIIFMDIVIGKMWFDEGLVFWGEKFILFLLKFES